MSKANVEPIDKEGHNIERELGNLLEDLVTIDGEIATKQKQRKQIRSQLKKLADQRSLGALDEEMKRAKTDPESVANYDADKKFWLKLIKPLPLFDNTEGTGE